MSPATRIFPALGTTAQITVDDAGALPFALAVFKSELAAVDHACSRFRTDSELTRLNESSGRSVPVSALLLDALEVGLRAAAATDGDVDPTIGRAMSGLGWDLDFSIVVSRREPRTIEVTPACGWRAIRLDRSRGTARVPRGIEVDLGATAKAFAADRCARAVADATGVGVLVSLGGDIAVCGRTPRHGWPVLVADDHRCTTTAHGQTIAIYEGGLATSSTTVRRWQAGGAERHHIVDPRSGLPVDPFWRTVSVSAASCVDANIASTAAIVRGESALPWLEALGLPARLVAVDGAVATTSCWPLETP
jgi:thiamine biosynthesis lipoprotein ApbE